MRKNWNHLEPYRVLEGPGRSSRLDLFGMFILPLSKGNEQVEILADNGTTTGWEHVSVKARRKNGKNSQTATPHWDIMRLTKELFWEPHETVIQYHPAESDYVNKHPSVLHLWRPIHLELPKPPKEIV